MRALTVTVMVIALGAGSGVALRLTRADPTGRPSARLGASLPTDRKAAADLLVAARAMHPGCKLREPVKRLLPRYAALLDVTARVNCPATASTSTSLHGLQFADTSHLAVGYDAYLRWQRWVSGSCRGGDGRIEWATRDGHIAGQALCASDDGTPMILWTDNDRNRIWKATADDRDELGGWWDRAARGPTPPHLTDRLQAAVGAQLGDHCTPVAASPTAQAALSCVPGDGKGTVNVEQYATAALMDTRMRLAGAAQAPSRRTIESCVSGYSWRTWGDGAHTRGELKCYPSGSYSVVLWTLRSKRLAFYFSDRGSPQYAYKLWRHYVLAGL